GAGRIGVADEIPDVGAELIGEHVGDRPRAQQAGFAEAAAVHQHRGKAQIVGRGGGRTAAAAFELARLGQLGAACLRLAGVGIGCQWLGVARRFLRRNRESGIAHAERAKQIGFTSLPWRAMAMTAPGIRPASISAFRTLSIRASRSAEKPASSGLARGRGSSAKAAVEASRQNALASVLTGTMTSPVRAACGPFVEAASLGLSAE